MIKVYSHGWASKDARAHGLCIYNGDRNTKEPHCLLRNPHEWKPVPYGNIHTNGQPTSGRRSEEMGLTMGQPQGAYARDG